MATRDLPPQLLFPESRFKVIRNGSVGIIFRISEIYAAKILFTGDIFNDLENFTIRQDSEALRNLQKEADINCQLYKNKVAVPNPVGVERLSIFSTSFPAYIMEYLPFPSGAELTYPESGIARNLAFEEIVKSSDFGFIPGQDWENPNNYMFDRTNKKSYLIDFGRWDFEPDYKRIEDGICEDL